MPSDQKIRPVTPFPLAMVVCDFIYRDPYTGKYTLMGTFSTISGERFPLIHPQLFVYVALTGGRGRMPVKLEIADADGTDVVAVIEDEIDSRNDPRAIQELAFAFTGLKFPKEGEYRVALHANNEFMVERRFLVFNPQDHT
jgi:hypothetical protein